MKNNCGQNLFLQGIQSFRKNGINAESKETIFYQMTRILRKRLFAYAKTKTQISFAVTAKLLISAFVFATQTVRSLYLLNLKFRVSSHLLWLYSLVCVGPGRKPQDRFSHNEAQITSVKTCITLDSWQSKTHLTIINGGTAKFCNKKCGLYQYLCC